MFHQAISSPNGITLLLKPGVFPLSFLPASHLLSTAKDWGLFYRNHDKNIKAIKCMFKACSCFTLGHPHGLPTSSPSFFFVYHNLSSSYILSDVRAFFRKPRWGNYSAVVVMYFRALQYASPLFCYKPDGFLRKRNKIIINVCLFNLFKTF